MSMLLPAWEALNIFSTDKNALLFQLHLYLTFLNFPIGNPEEMQVRFITLNQYITENNKLILNIIYREVKQSTSTWSNAEVRALLPKPVRSLLSQ